MKLSVVTPCYHEEDNVVDLHAAIADAVSKTPGITSWEHIFIDNASKDSTAARIKEICKKDPAAKLIVNARNFGHIRSPVHALLQASGDLVILMASDFQDPPSLIPELVAKWREGFKVVICVKNKSEESALMFFIRTSYYNLIGRLSDIELTKNYTGFGAYDREVIDTVRKIDDPYPYFRGLIADLGYASAKIYFTQPSRKRGITKNNFYTLYDIAMLGITNHSKVPLRIATMTGFALSAMSLGVSFIYLIAKLLFWSTFQLGLAPLVIGLFFFSSVQLFFIGILGEYIGSIHTQVHRRPLVIEKERVGF